MLASIDLAISDRLPQTSCSLAWSLVGNQSWSFGPASSSGLTAARASDVAGFLRSAATRREVRLMVHRRKRHALI